MKIRATLIRFLFAVSLTGTDWPAVAAGLGPNRDLRDLLASQQRGVKFLCALLDLMGPLDCPALVGPVYSYAGRAGAATQAERRKQWRTVVKNLKIVAAYAEAREKSSASNR